MANLTFPPSARKMFREECEDLAQQHLQRALELRNENDYAAVEYHINHYLYHLPTQGIA